MGRAMLIICAGTLVSLGIVAIGTSNQGKMLTSKTVEYAQKTKAINSAHTAIQIAMQEINEDDSWAENHDSSNPWVTTIDGVVDSLYVDYIYNSTASGNNYWDPDSIRMVSKSTIVNDNQPDFKARVISVYLKAPFSTLVPEFSGALQFPSGYGSLTVDGNAHAINGQADHCEEDRPAIAVNNSETKDGLQSYDLNLDGGNGSIGVDNDLDYEPTDELIERLENSGNAITVNSDYSESLGTADNPGVFFIDGNVKLTGQQSEGYGIMVIKNSANMEYEDEDGNTLDIRGNFEFNGLVIFENAQLFDGHGTPTINGSVLVGDTEGETDIDVDIGGNIEINYDCDGENYARMAAAESVDQYKYSRVVTLEETEFLD
jgi:hypothetical protein